VVDNPDRVNNKEEEKYFTRVLKTRGGKIWHDHSFKFRYSVSYYFIKYISGLTKDYHMKENKRTQKDSPTSGNRIFWRICL